MINIYIIIYVLYMYLYILIHVFIKNISCSLHNKNLSKHQAKINTVHTKSGNEQYPPGNEQ